MNREIKFRAFFQDDNAGEEPIMTYDLAFEEYGTINDQLGSVPTLMQYTGLKDKKGVEIYEGDILKKESYPQKNIVVEFMNGKFNISDHAAILNKMRVIGNIYEHPHLLDQK